MNERRVVFITSDGWTGTPLEMRWLLLSRYPKSPALQRREDALAERQTLKLFNGTTNGGS